MALDHQQQLMEQISQQALIREIKGIKIVHNSTVIDLNTPIKLIRVQILGHKY